MSLISNALKKVQDARQHKRVSKTEHITTAATTPVAVAEIPATDTLEPQAINGAPNNISIPTLIVGTIAVILISITAAVLISRTLESKQIKLLSLEQTLQAQEKQIHDLVTYLNRSKAHADAQAHAFNLRLDKETQERKSQIDDATLNNKNNYTSLKEAIIDDKQEIVSLDKFTKALDQKIQAIPVSSNQTN